MKVCTTYDEIVLWLSPTDETALHIQFKHPKNCKDKNGKPQLEQCFSPLGYNWHHNVRATILYIQFTQRWSFLVSNTVLEVSSICSFNSQALKIRKSLQLYPPEMAIKLLFFYLQCTCCSNFQSYVIPSLLPQTSQPALNSVSGCLITSKEWLISEPPNRNSLWNN